MDQQHEIAAPVVKATTAWAAVGLTSWADVASFLAACYTAILMTEWAWKRFLRAALVKRGLIK